MENDFASTVQKYFFFLLVGITLLLAIGAIVILASSIL